MSRRMGLILAAASLLAFRAGTVEQEESPQSGVVTLWSQDATQATFNFESGTYGGQIVDGELRLEDAHIAFNLFEANQFTYGILRHSAGHVVDLGESFVNPLREAAAQSPKPALSIFHTLKLQRSRVVYTVPPGKIQRHSAGSDILSTLPGTGVRHFAPEIGHTYLFRYQSGGLRARGGIIVKIFVVDVQPGRNVTFRWARLS